MWKIKTQKIVGDILPSKIVYEYMVIETFLAILKSKKILGNICFSEQIFYRKQSLGVPVNVLFLIYKDKSGKLEENLADDQSHLGVKLIALKVKYVGL